MKNETEDLRLIREMMERSSKFLSLSGLAGVFAGIFALAGAAFAYFYLLRDPSMTDYNRFQENMILLGDALVVLVLSLGSAVFFSSRKARRTGQRLFNKTTYRILYNFSIPLVTGGIFCLMFLLRGNFYIAISGTLIFYGLALTNASRYTYGEVHYLGLTEIVLGLLAAYFSRHGILFWTLGFGVCHIVYGVIMYLKYDRRSHA